MDIFRNKKLWLKFCAVDNKLEKSISDISFPTEFRKQKLVQDNFLYNHTKIIESPFLVKNYGELLLKDKFKLKKPKRRKLTVFLFENIILMATEHVKEDVYYYFASIKISDLSLAPLGRSKKKILLKDFNNSKYSKTDIEYKLEAKTEEMQNTWREIIQKCLWLQLLSAKDHQSD